MYLWLDGTIQNQKQQKNVMSLQAAVFGEEILLRRVDLLTYLLLASICHCICCILLGEWAMVMAVPGWLLCDGEGEGNGWETWELVWEGPLKAGWEWGDEAANLFSPPVVNLASAASASGKFGGVAGVLAGVHSWKQNRKRHMTINWSGSIH